MTLTSAPSRRGRSTDLAPIWRAPSSRLHRSRGASFLGRQASFRSTRMRPSARSCTCGRKPTPASSTSHRRGRRSGLAFRPSGPSALPTLRSARCVPIHAREPGVSQQYQRSHCANNRTVSFRPCRGDGSKRWAVRASQWGGPRGVRRDPSLWREGRRGQGRPQCKLNLHHLPSPQR